MELKRIDTINEELIDEISNIFQKVWGGDIKLIYEKTKWAFLNDRSMIIVSKDSDQISGVRGGFQWPLVLEEEIINSYQLHGTCVLPAYRRQGLFTKMNIQFLKTVSLTKNELIFNVSVRNSRLGYEKLGWIYLNGFRRLTRFENKTRIINNFKQLRVPGIPKTGDFSEVEIIDSNVLKSRSEALKSLIHTPYNIDFLSWRLSNRGQGYKILKVNSNIVIYKIQTKGLITELIIGDILLIDYNYKQIKKAIEKLIALESPDILTTYIFRNHPLYKLLLINFFIPNPFSYNAHFGVRLLNDSGHRFLESSNWGLTFLEIDTF